MREKAAITPLTIEAPMPDPPSTHWGPGRIVLRVVHPDGTRRVVAIDRPYALLGRAQAADLRISHPDASLRHAYLHLDRRGVYAVDLATRTGTRFDGIPPEVRAAWIRPGRGLEFAGHRVELVEGAFDHGSRDGEPVGPDPLAATEGLVPLELVPDDLNGRPLRPRSALAFLGSNRSCALRFTGDELARVHGVLVRTTAEAFLVDFVGSGVASVAAVRAGDRLEIGRRGYSARIGPSPAAPLPVISRSAVIATVDRVAPTASPELREALARRMFETLQFGQDLLLRSHDQLQRSMLEATRTLSGDRTDTVDRHRAQLDQLRSELTEARAELRRRLAERDTVALAHIPGPPPIPRDQLAVPVASFGQATSWLLDRVADLERAIDREPCVGGLELLAQLRPR